MPVSIKILSHIENYAFPDTLLWGKDLEGRYLKSNQPLATFFGFKQNREMAGVTDYDLRSAAVELAEVFQACDKQVISQKADRKFLEIVKSTKQEMRVMAVTKAPIVGDAGIFIGTFGRATDMTDHFLKLGCLLTKSHPHKYSQQLSVSSFTIGAMSGSPINLTSRQAECLFFLLRHKTIQQISLILNLSVRTIETYVEQLKIKFYCPNKNALLEKALSLGFFYMVPESIFSQQLSMALEL